MSDAHRLIGQCACGASLTAYHLLHNCPLRPQRNELDSAALVELCHAVQRSRLDTAHVAVLGEN